MPGFHEEEEGGTTIPWHLMGSCCYVAMLLSGMPT